MPAGVQNVMVQGSVTALHVKGMDFEEMSMNNHVTTGVRWAPLYHKSILCSTSIHELGLVL